MQLFRGTSITLARTDGSPPFVEGVAVRLGHEGKMYRECSLATDAPPSVMLRRMSRIGAPSSHTPKTRAHPHAPQTHTPSTPQPSTPQHPTT